MMRPIDADAIPYVEAINSETLKGTGDFYASRNDVDALPTILSEHTIGLTKGEASAIAEFIDMNIFSAIRADTDWDSVQNLRNLIHGYEKCCKASGYVGLTETEVDDEQAN